MTTGFVQRWKGKVAFPVGGLSIGGTKLTGSGADLNVNTGWATVQSTGTITNGSTMPNSGVTQLLSTALAIYNLADPSPGVQKVIEIAAGSSAVLIKTSTLGTTIQGASTTLGASTLTNVMKSTATLVATSIELLGLSTSQYLFMGVYPSTLSHLLFSTTT